MGKFPYLCVRINFAIMKKFAKLIIVVISAAILASCSSIGNIQLLDYDIKEATPESFYSIKGVVALKLANFGPALTLTEIQGELFHAEQSMGTFTVDDVYIPARNSNWIDASGHILIDESVSLLSVLALAKNFKMEEYSVSVSTKVKLGIFKKTITVDRMPLSELAGKQ